MANEWLDYQDRRDEKKHDADEKAAFEVAERVTAPEAPLTKRRVHHNTWDRPPLDGCSIERSNLLRDIVALRFGGNALREAFKKVAETHGIIPNTAEKYYYNHKNAVTLAEEEHLNNAIKEYHHNLWAVRTMMSEAGPKAVKVIVAVMNSHKSSPNVKLKAAQAILRMIDVDGSASGNTNESVAKESLKLVRDVINKRDEEQGSHVVEFVETEVLEEDDECDN